VVDGCEGRVDVAVAGEVVVSFVGVFVVAVVGEVAGTESPGDVGEVSDLSGNTKPLSAHQP